MPRYRFFLAQMNQIRQGEADLSPLTPVPTPVLWVSWGSAPLWHSIEKDITSMPTGTQGALCGCASQTGGTDPCPG